MSTANKSNIVRDALAEIRPFFLKAAAFGFLVGLLSLVPTWYMLDVYDRVVNSRNLYTLLMLSLVAVFLYAVMELIDWSRGHLLYVASTRVESNLRKKVFDAICQAGSRRMAGVGIQPLNDLRTLREFIYSPVMTALFELPVSALLLVVMFVLSPLMGWAAAVGALVQALISWLNERGSQPPLFTANRAAIASQQQADASLRNAEVIAAMGMLPAVHSRWKPKQTEFLKLQASASDVAGGFQALSKTWQTIVGSGILGLGVWASMHNLVMGGAGMVMVASILGGKVIGPLVQGIAQWRSVLNARDAANRLNQIFNHLSDKAEGMSLPPPKGLVACEQVVAGPPGQNTPIVKGISFQLAPGEALALVGPSASGKTTLARVLIGFWPTYSGKVRLDGADIHEWPKRELGPHIGYLPQDVEISDGTLAENICRFATPDEAQLQAAIDAAGLQELIQNLPNGVHTEIGDDGGTVLSGGQRQRVGLARALYGEPAFVVLDEPNSNLDEVGEAALLSAITRMKQKGTSFVIITHRTNVLRVIDKILLMRDGQQHLYGPRDEVLAALSGAPANNRQAVSAG